MPDWQELPVVSRWESLPCTYEVRGTHPGLDRSERMFCGLTSGLHPRWIPIEPCLHFIEHLLVLPATDLPVRTGRAL